MKKNKTPGCDGLTVELYLTFWDQISDLVVNSLNEGYNNEILLYTQRQSIITLLYKKGDPENLENWRPISLLNTDYKILTGSLANRLKKSATKFKINRVI